MGKIIIGSARMGENGSVVGGKSGDQKQKTAEDYSGEVSMQNFYLHKKGWYIMRWKDAVYAEECAKAMHRACNNANIGYDQSNRNGILKAGTRTTTKTECDCSALVRQCIKEAAPIKYRSGTPIYNGDILVTCSKGHTAVVVSAIPRVPTLETAKYYPPYLGKSSSIVDALASLGVNASKDNRRKIAAANGIPSYSGTAQENTYLLNLLTHGKLIK